MFHVPNRCFFIWIFTDEVLFEAESLRYVTLGINDSLNFSEMFVEFRLVIFHGIRMACDHHIRARI